MAHFVKEKKGQKAHMKKGARQGINKGREGTAGRNGGQSGETDRVERRRDGMRTERIKANGAERQRGGRAD
ncbi:hypothetical protein C1H46_041758 [Malus baccata]|uniref:Uncharacterized protein n=1 Tax=Malus baccata TaxID=106549 RepID=A0A540KEP5_MALBA|nr:hypothetical protein C1H46_041758 [Malus baccata]